MASVGTVVIEVDADIAKFIDGINRTNRTLSSLESRARKAKKQIANFASAVMGIYAVSEAFSIARREAGKFLETASDFEQYENGLSSFYVGQNNLNKAMQRGVTFADDFNLSLKDTFESMHKMKVYGIDPTAKRLEEYGNVGIGAMKSVDQYVEMMADAMMGEFERTKEFGVKASQTAEKVQFAWSDSSGKARSVVVKNNKKIIQSTLETIFNEKYVGQLEKYKNSWKGFVQGLKTDYQLFQKAVMDAGLFSYIKALTSSFTQEWTKSFGDTKETAKQFSDYLKEMIKSLIETVAFFIDSWKGVKLVWATLKTAFWGVVSFIGGAINGIVDAWDSMGVTMHNTWKSLIDTVGEAWSSFVNFFIKGINVQIEALTSLGNDVLEFMGIDPIEPLQISLSKYESSIERVEKSNKKFADFSFSDSKLHDSLKEVSDIYKDLRDDSAQEFVANVLSKVEGEQKKIIKNEKELDKKRKDAKKALADLLKGHEGTLKSLKKENEEKSKGNRLVGDGNKLAKEAKRIAKELIDEQKRKRQEAKKEWSEYDKYVETEWDKTTKYLFDSLDKNFFALLDGKFSSLKDTFKSFADGLVLDPLKHNVSKNLSGATLAMLGINTTADGKTLDSYLGDNGFKQVAGEFVKYVGDTKVVIDQAGNVLEGQEKVSTDLMDNLSVLKSAYSTYTAGLQASIMQPFANAGTFLAEHGYATAGSSITSLGVGVANPFSTGIVAGQGGWGSMAGASAGIGQMAVGGLVGYGVGTLGDKLFGADTQAGNLGALGGAIGTAILPGLGTAIGAGLGSVIGGMFGSTKVTDTGILFNSLSSYNNFDALSYVDKEKSSWFSSSSSTDTSALGKDVEERINSVFHTYDYLLNQLEIFNSNLAITGGKYSQDSFIDEIARSFLGTITGGGKEDIKSSLLKQVEGLTDPMDIANILYKGLFGRLPEEFNNGSGVDYEYFVNALNSLGTEGIINNLIARGTAETLNSSLKQSNELLDVWKKYAKSVDKNVMETLSEAFGEYTTKKRSFDIWRSSSYGDDIGALGKKKDYALQDLKFTLDSVGDSTITVDNYLERMNEALRGNPTPQVLQDWENLGDALIKASDSVKAFQDAVRKDMSSLIKDEVDRLRNLREATKANIVSLQNKQAQYLPQTTIYSSDVYKAIGDWSPKKDQAIQNLIDTWRNQQIEVANKQVEAEKTRIDNINKEIEANNRLRETILKLKDSVQATFDNIRGLSDSSKKESLQNAIDNKEYDKINSLFSSYASSKIDNAGYFGRVDALVEIAKMNQQVQELDTPVEKTKLEASLKIQELTDNINKSVATMYEALIKQNENYLPNIDGQLMDIFVQNQQYFDENSDIYKFMEQSAMGTKEETFEQRMQEQYDLYQTTSELETTMLDRNFKNLGDISKQLNVKTNNNANDIAELRRELTALRKAQEESNRIAQQQLAVAQETANNTKESGVIA